MAGILHRPELRIVDAWKERHPARMGGGKPSVVRVSEDAVRDSTADRYRLNGRAEENTVADHTFAKTFDVRSIGAADGEHEAIISKCLAHAPIALRSGGRALDAIRHNNHRACLEVPIIIRIRRRD